MESFKKYYKFPLKQDEFANFIVWTFEDERAFDFILRDKQQQEKIISVLNNEIDDTILNELTHKDGAVYIEGEKLLNIRSWGHLTGVGGLNLSSEEAASIQDEFCEWIIKKLQPKN